MLYTHKCHKCNYEGSGNFYFAGPHLKQVCGKCGFYIKFADKPGFASVFEIRHEIWNAAKGDKDLIDAAKMELPDYIFDGVVVLNHGIVLTGLHAKLAYYKLYLNVLKFVK